MTEASAARRKEQLLGRWLDEHHFDSIEEPEERERLLSEGRRIVAQRINDRAH